MASFRVLIVAIAICCATPLLSRAQDSLRTTQAWKPDWRPMFGSFLEPSRFSTVYDRTPEYLRLEAGFGANTSIFSETSLGAECLIWSGLKTLSNFRFPVETADYFFGLYSVFPVHLSFLDHPLRTRVRLSHISSHLVDGTPDTVVGGSSSHYSREFIALDGEYGDNDMFHRGAFRGSLGIKYVFHQVTKVEPTLQVPATIEYIPLRYGTRNENECFLSLSDEAGAYFPLYALSVVNRISNETLGSRIDLYAEYHHGATRYGVKGTLIENGFEVGIRIGPNLLVQ